MSRPIRILHVFDHSLPLHSGYSFRSRSIISLQRELSLETYHLTSARQGPTSSSLELVDGLEFHRSPALTTWLGKLPGLEPRDVVLGMRIALIDLISKCKPDIIHAHSPCLTGMAALPIARKQRIPLVYECRAFWEDAAVDLGTASANGLRYQLTRYLESRVFNRANAITTICEGLKRDIVSRGNATSKITVIPNAVNADQFQPVAETERQRMRAKLGIGENFVVGFIGSFYHYEGLDYLIDTFEKLSVNIPSAKLMLVGGGPEEGALKSLARSKNIDVLFTGRVGHEEVPGYYSAMDVLVYPRRSIRLTELVTPLKPLEALAFEKPVVASDIGGHRELLTDEVTASLFDLGNPDTLGSALKQIKEDPEGAKARAAAGREFVLSERNWRASVSRYLSVYEDLMKS